MTTPILEVRGVSQRFGKFQALSNVSVAFQPGKLTAIIGPNGAGKSTFFNVVSGAFPPTEGSIHFLGSDITGLPQHEFARIGIAKSFQITNVFKQLSRARERAGRRADAACALRAAAAARGDARADRPGRPPARAGRPAAGARQAGRRPCARPAARAGDRDGAGLRAEAAADGRAHRRHVAGGNHDDDGADRVAGDRAHGDPGRAQDEAGDGPVRAAASCCTTASSWPRARRTRSAAMPRSGASISANIKDRRMLQSRPGSMPGTTAATWCRTSPSTSRRARSSR